MHCVTSVQMCTTLVLAIASPIAAISQDDCSRNVVFCAHILGAGAAVDVWVAGELTQHHVWIFETLGCWWDGPPATVVMAEYT
jgi:hypothetical protein